SINFSKWNTAWALLIIGPLLLLGCDIQDSPTPIQEDRFEEAGLQQEIVNSFLTEGNEIYVATDNGVRRMIDPDSDNTEWDQLGLSGLDVVDIVRRGDGSLIAAVQRDDTQSEEPVLYRQADPEADWEAMETDYGGDQNYTYINRLIVHPQDSNLLFARGAYSVLRSMNGGETWQPVFGDWESTGYLSDLLEVDPGNPDRMWAGGETSSFQPYLYRSDDRGSSWDNGLLDAGGDNAVYSIAFHPDDEDRILLGMEGEIRFSDDAGESWETSRENDSYNYIVTMASPEEIPSETVIASGSEGGTSNENLFFLLTRDFGETWEKETADPPISDIYITDLHIEETAGLLTIWLATNQGVWVYRQGGQG
ncbi:MAG: hypothetical protein LAT80_15275, partial [Balneolaceae bacterium]|nr:hypothetical protein [Balneolaceae bacterium]